MLSSSFLLSFYAIASGLLTLAYIWVMARYLYHWQQAPDFELPKEFQPQTSVSVLVPARNESANVEACLLSIKGQAYPPELLEIVLIDDHSTDDTLQKAEALARKHPQIRVLRLQDFLTAGEKVHSYKKRAIELGIQQSKGQLIVCTDADCEVPVRWLQYLTAYYESTRHKFIAAPVNFFRESNLLEQFQSLDFLGMMGITAAGIQGRFMHMCNGANLAYERQTFEAVGGFAGIDHLASGDDMLLMQKVAAKYPGRIGFVKQAAVKVQTKAQPDWSSFVQQRVRWGSKSGDYHEWQVTAMLAVVFLLCCNILLSVLLIPLLGWWAVGIFGFQLLFKSIADYFLLSRMARFFHRSDLMAIFVPAQLLHILYIAVVGSLSNLRRTYQWKGRQLQ